jgi:hypothetical protein
MRPSRLLFSTVSTLVLVTFAAAAALINSPTTTLSTFSAVTDLVKSPTEAISTWSSASLTPSNLNLVIVGSGYNGTIDCGAFGIKRVQALEDISGIQNAYNAKSKAFHEQRKQMNIDGFVENGRISLPCIWNKIKLSYYTYDFKERLNSLKVSEEAVKHLTSFCWASDGAVAESGEPKDITTLSKLLQFGPKSVDRSYKSLILALYSVGTNRLAVQEEMLETCGCWFWEPHCKMMG